MIRWPDPNYMPAPKMAIQLACICDRCFCLVPPDNNAQRRHTEFHRELDGPPPSDFIVKMRDDG